MRARSTLIAVFILLLSGCNSLEPQIKQSDKDALANLKGPEINTIDATLKNQAQQAENAGDYTKAAETYKQLLDKNPTNKDYQLAFADDLRRAGNNDFALKIDEQILKKDPSNAAVMENKGLALMNTGEYTDAGKVFDQVMQIDPKRWRTLNGVGILFAMKNRTSDALAYYHAALDVDANNATVLNNMGLTLAMDKKYDEAYDTFARAKRHLPEGSPQIRSIDLNLALVYAIAGRLDDAEHTAAPHLSKAGLYNNMGFYSYLAKNDELAKGYLNMALTQSPVYYERAWKNLNALSGDNSLSGGNAASSGGMLKMPPSAPSNAVPKDPSIKLEDIPASKPAQPAPSDNKDKKSED